MPEVRPIVNTFSHLGIGCIQIASSVRSFRWLWMVPPGPALAGRSWRRGGQDPNGKALAPADLIYRHNLWTKNVLGAQVFALGKSQLSNHLLHLGSAGRAVIKDGVPDDTGQIEIQVHQG